MSLLKVNVVEYLIVMRFFVGKSVTFTGNRLMVKTV